MSEQRIVLSSFGIDHDANVTFVYGVVEGGTHFNLKNTRIVTILEPDTEIDRQAYEMLTASWIKAVGTEGYRAVPSTVTLVVDDVGNIIRIEETALAAR